MNTQQRELETLMRIGISLSAEKDRNKLLEFILSEAMKITRCDAGTLYLAQEDNTLAFHIAYNNSLRLENSGQLPSVPLDETNICAYAAIHRQMVNIPDVRCSERFDFSGPIRYDAMTGYHTKSMLVVPMEDNESSVIGVLQLINALSEEGEIIGFDERFETMVYAIASQTAVALNNMRYMNEIEELFHYFLSVIYSEIYESSPYNANHSRNMAIYAEKFIGWLNDRHAEGKSEHWFDEQKRSEFIMSVLLHDIGKLVIPLEVMDKPDRLGDKLPMVLRRLDVIRLLAENDRLSGKFQNEEGERLCRRVSEIRSFVQRINTSHRLEKTDIDQINSFKDLEFVDLDGTRSPWFTPDEIQCLLIRKGTLTDKERQTMQSHVVITGRLLGQINFSSKYKRVPLWAAGHHEFLDGSGYPNGLHGDQIPYETRLLTVIDIYDALVAQDRPYRPAMPVKKAVSVLREMVQQGKIDGEIVEDFIEGVICLD